MPKKLRKENYESYLDYFQPVVILRTGQKTKLTCYLFSLLHSYMSKGEQLLIPGLL